MMLHKDGFMFLDLFCSIGKSGNSIFCAVEQKKKQVFDRETHVARTLGVQGVFVGRHAGCHIDCDSRYSFSSYVNFSSRFGHV